jgi:hypothetical protein
MRLAAVLLVLTGLTAAAPTTSSAQGIRGAIKKKADEARKKLNDEAAKKSAADSAKQKADSLQAAASSGAASQGTAAAAAAPAKPSSKIWENYDFVPGSRILFYTDFSEDRVGNFAPAMDRSPKSAEAMWNVKDQGIARGGTDVGRSQKHLPDEEITGFVGQLTHLRILMDSNYYSLAVTGIVTSQPLPLSHAEPFGAVGPLRPPWPRIAAICA